MPQMPKNQYIAQKFPARTSSENTAKKRDPKVDFKTADPRIKQFPNIEIQPDVEIRPDTTGWYTRFESAQFLGVSITTIGNYERGGKLHPQHEYRKDSRGFEQRVAVYDPKQLAPLRKGAPQHQQRFERITDPGELAARCFELFDQGKSFREIVIAVRQTLNQVRDLHESWLDAGGADLTITPLIKEGFQKIVGEFSDVTELLSLVENLAKKNPATE